MEYVVLSVSILLALRAGWMNTETAKTLKKQETLLREVEELEARFKDLEQFRVQATSKLHTVDAKLKYQQDWLDMQEGLARRLKSVVATALHDSRALRKAFDQAKEQISYEERQRYHEKHSLSYRPCCQCCRPCHDRKSCLR